MSYPTKAEVLTAVSGLLGADQNPDQLLQEMVDRIYSEGWTPESREELTFDPADFFELSEETGEKAIKMPLAGYVAILKFRTDIPEMPWKIAGQEARFSRPTVARTRFVDLGRRVFQEIIEGVEVDVKYRLYRVPDVLVDYGEMIYGLAEKRAPNYADDVQGDMEVPVPVASLCKLAMQAISYENQTDLDRADKTWARFRDEYLRAIRRDDGPKEVRVVIRDTLRTIPVNFP